MSQIFENRMPKMMNGEVFSLGDIEEVKIIYPNDILKNKGAAGPF